MIIIILTNTALPRICYMLVAYIITNGRIRFQLKTSPSVLLCADDIVRNTHEAKLNLLGYL